MVLILLIVVALVFCVRRRTRARRDHRANVWWFSSKRTSQTYGDGDETQVANVNGTRSARSSFATTVDHSITHQRSSEFVIPPLPPMAEVGRGNGAAPSLVLDTSYFASTDANVNASDPRFSIGSGHSNASETSLNAQYLVVHPRDSLNNNNTNNNEPFTPMSVRPFSPSESFAFPRPPDPVGDRTSAYSRVSSGVSMGMGASRSQSSPTEAPALPLPLLSVSPISPTLVHPATPTAATADVITPVNPFADDNPFDDPAAVTAASGLPTPSAPASNPPTGEFADIEYIRRPFYPTLPDELAVKPDDNVRVLQAFDDGWALVEKVDGSGKGKGREDEVRQGLIPIDCLREPGLDLTTFIEAKRVSGYDESVGYQSVVAI
ncbi:hypothetical protein CPB84DRAFT_196943 [Gymnopilus junonius]|uniref:SH3 domain-containing protein n=1 Tax=Gymnopilus junonius TaxID=109634 RepID=A0A9P5ND15_GYMJU|nr:hypothetical protein CPB84DRAFT_196943 [Gymnopilus junonius]